MQVHLRESARPEARFVTVVNVADLEGLLQALDLGADGIMGILQAIDEAGALYGTLVVT